MRVKRPSPVMAASRADRADPMPRPFGRRRRRPAPRRPPPRSADRAAAPTTGGVRRFRLAAGCASRAAVARSAAPSRVCRRRLIGAAVIDCRRRGARGSRRRPSGRYARSAPWSTSWSASSFGFAGGFVGRIKGSSFLPLVPDLGLLPVVGLLVPRALPLRHRRAAPAVPGLRACRQAPRRPVHPLRRGLEFPEVGASAGERARSAPSASRRARRRRLGGAMRASMP